MHTHVAPVSLSPWKPFLLRTAFGRVIDVQRGEADELTKACTSLFTDVRKRITYAELVIVLLCELHS